jgi:hypothetical protein
MVSKRRALLDDSPQILRELGQMIMEYSIGKGGAHCLCLFYCDFLAVGFVNMKSPERVFSTTC